MGSKQSDVPIELTNRNLKRRTKMAEAKLTNAENTALDHIEAKLIKPTR
jgi:hypothetical protein